MKMTVVAVGKMCIRDRAGSRCLFLRAKLSVANLVSKADRYGAHVARLTVMASKWQG